MASDVCASAASQLTVDLGALRDNYRKLAAFAAPADCAAVIKADGAAPQAITWLTKVLGADGISPSEERFLHRLEKSLFA